ncbi:MAG: hypothetical protein ACI4MJ_00995 [Aristaeellaceae bacterium]
MRAEKMYKLDCGTSSERMQEIRTRNQAGDIDPWQLMLEIGASRRL